MPPARPARRCSVCMIASVRILRFSLVQSITKPDGRHSTRGAGRIDLCERCWAESQRAIDRLGHRRPRPRRVA